MGKSRVAAREGNRNLNSWWWLSSMEPTQTRLKPSCRARQWCHQRTGESHVLQHWKPMEAPYNSTCRSVIQTQDSASATLSLWIFWLWGTKQVSQSQARVALCGSANSALLVCFPICHASLENFRSPGETPPPDSNWRPSQPGSSSWKFEKRSRMRPMWQCGNKIPQCATWGEVQ